VAERRSRVREEAPTTSHLPADSDSIQRLYANNVTVIYRFIYSKVGNREEAEDLTSKVFMKAMQNVDSTRSVESVQSWLFQIARTTVADFWRDFYRLRADSLDTLLTTGWEAAAGKGGAEPREHHSRQVEQILSRLPVRYREVLTYRFLLCCTIKETAERMSLSEANVKVLQFRALKRAAGTSLEAT
jgi:RNA polymerase sigma-70 factor (ECF subfamily)